MANPLPLDQRLSTAGQLVLRARISYDIWWLYEGVGTRPKIIDAMRVYSEFFRFDTHAHFISMVMHLSAVFEDRRDTINFNRLIKDAEKAGIKEEAIKHANVCLETSRNVAKNLAKLRHKVIAHRDYTLPYDEVFKLAAVKPDEIRVLTETGLEIVNTLLKSRGFEEVCFTDLPLDDAKKLIRDLETHRMVRASQ